MKRIQRAVQAVTLSVFLILLILAAFPLSGGAPVDAFLRMDPLAGGIAVVSGRAVILAIWPAVVLVLLTFFLGRFFCGHVCPMGTTIDLVEFLMKKKKKRMRANRAVLSSHWKYLLLTFIFGAALFGISLSFLASPLPLITRFYGTLVFPVIQLGTDIVLQAVRPLADWLDWTTVVYAKISVQRFANPWFIALFFSGVFSASLLVPRFWCRYLCPAGAVFAMCSHRPLVHRRVTDDCIDCGECQRSCPMHAIDDVDPGSTAHRECISCLKCSEICPVEAIHFSAGPPLPRHQGAPLSRRQVIGAGLGGAATAAVSLTGLHHSHGSTGVGNIFSPEVIRPPGSIPEDDFLARCLRCGECMKACPTNTIQPLGLAIGITGLFSPVLTPRRGPCEPGCNVCGQVCPTGAIRDLLLLDKQWAKVGTAQILKHKCLAWELNQRCLVCDEVCPYDAVELIQLPTHKVGVPVVHETRCAGCGFCEHHCPVRAEAAIVVDPMGEMRLAKGSYEAQARSIGVSLKLAKDQKIPGPGSYPGLGESPSSGGYPGAGQSSSSSELPPGFTE